MILKIKISITAYNAMKAEHIVKRNSAVEMSSDDDGAMSNQQRRSHAGDKLRPAIVSLNAAKRHVLQSCLASACRRPAQFHKPG